MRIAVTSLVLPGGHRIELTSPIEYEEGTPIPLVLTLAGKPAISIQQMEWYEYEPSDEFPEKAHFVARSV